LLENVTDFINRHYKRKDTDEGISFVTDFSQYGNR